MIKIDRKFFISAENRVNKRHYSEYTSFLMCAKDEAVPAALEAYITRCRELGASADHIKSAELLLGRVIQFQKDEHKVPDTDGDEIDICILDGE